VIWQFILDNFLFGSPPDEFSDDQSLLGRGIIDSTGILELVEFMEERFGITIGEEEMVPQNLDSLSSLVGFVGRKTGGAGQGLPGAGRPAPPAP